MSYTTSSSSHPSMTPSQALSLLGQAAAAFVGTRADHEKLAQAFAVLEPLAASPALSADSAAAASAPASGS